LGWLSFLSQLLFEIRGEIEEGKKCAAGAGAIACAWCDQFTEMSTAESFLTFPKLQTQWKTTQGALHHVHHFTVLQKETEQFSFERTRPCHVEVSSLVKEVTMCWGNCFVNMHRSCFIATQKTSWRHL